MNPLMNYFGDTLRASLIRNCLALSEQPAAILVKDVGPFLPPPGTSLEFSRFHCGRHRALGTPLNLSLEECVWYLTNPEGSKPEGFVWSEYDYSLRELLINPRILRVNPLRKVIEASVDPLYNDWVIDLNTKASSMAETLTPQALRALQKRFVFVYKNTTLVDMVLREVYTLEDPPPLDTTFGLTFEEVLGVLESSETRPGRPRVNPISLVK